MYKITRTRIALEGAEGKIESSIEINATLDANSWGVWSNNIMGDGSAVTITNTIDADRVFYRVIAE